MLAAKRLLSRVSPLMSHHGRLLTGPITAILTPERLLTRVNALMTSHVSVNTCSIIAVPTPERLHSSMNALVTAHLAPISRPILTIPTAKGFLSSVLALVNHHDALVPRPIVTVSTADVPLLVVSSAALILAYSLLISPIAQTAQAAIATTRDCTGTIIITIRNQVPSLATGTCIRKAYCFHYCRRKGRQPRSWTAFKLT